MKHKISPLLIVALLSGVLGSPCCLAREELVKFSLEPSFEITGPGLSYAVYGRSVISQSTLYQHSAFQMGSLPEGASVVKAFLYWSSELEAHKSADTKIELKDPQGAVTVINAEKVWTNIVSGLVYVSKAEVSGYLKGSGTYEISHIDADPIEPMEIAGRIKKKAHYTLGGWWLVVLFKDPHVKSETNIQIYDGLLYLPSGEGQREGRNVSKKALYPQTIVTMKDPGLAQATTLDLATICGFGRPWDGGSVAFDGVPTSGREDFTGNAGFSWDINRDLISLGKMKGRKQHEIEFLPDYNSIMPVAIVAKFDNPQRDEIVRLAASYVEQADSIEGFEFFDLRDSALENRESAVKTYLKDILHAKAVSLFKTIKNLNLNDSYGLHLGLGRLYLKENQFDLAEMELKEAANSSTEKAQAYLSLGQLYYEKREIDQAILYLKDAKKLSGDNPIVFQNLGICFLQKGLLEDAVKEFEEAVRLDPADLTSYRCLYNIYDSQGRSDKKSAVLKRIEVIEKSGQK